MVTEAGKIEIKSNAIKVFDNVLVALWRGHERGRATVNILRRFMVDESGATAIEYALIASLIAVAAITAMTTVGTALQNSFSNVSASL